MASRKLSEKDLAEVEALAKQWGKIVVRRGFGDEGPGLDVDLDTMEQLAVAAARGLTAGTLEAATLRQAEHLSADQPCPACRRLCPVLHEERYIKVRGGEFLHNEPICHCPACRRDFFPSASSLEVGHARLQHGHAPQDR